MDTVVSKKTGRRNTEKERWGKEREENRFVCVSVCVKVMTEYVCVCVCVCVVCIYVCMWK